MEWSTPGEDWAERQLRPNAGWAGRHRRAGGAKTVSLRVDLRGDGVLCARPLPVAAFRFFAFRFAFFALPRRPGWLPCVAKTAMTDQMNRAVRARPASRDRRESCPGGGRAESASEPRGSRREEAQSSLDTRSQRLSRNLSPVGQAFQPAGPGGFPAPSWFDGLESPSNRQPGKAALPGSWARRPSTDRGILLTSAATGRGGSGEF